MLKCLICFILGWFVSRHMGNGFRVGGEVSDSGSGRLCKLVPEIFKKYTTQSITNWLGEKEWDDAEITCKEKLSKFPFCGGKMLDWCIETK